MSTELKQGEAFPTSALRFEIKAKCSTTKARASTLHLPHGPVQLPIFMPVATQASLKGLTPEQLEETGCRLCLNNTYHLGLKPGQAVLDTIGGAHKLQGWKHNILTDSGGSVVRSERTHGATLIVDLHRFQMVSLLKLAKVTEEGVRFLSPHDGTPMYVRSNIIPRLLTPEHSISLQNTIGSDIIMQLDDVIQTTSPDHARMREAMGRSIRWLDRCIAAHKHPDRQNLFCIIQGGLDLEMRRECAREMAQRDTPGIAIGGLSGGEEKAKFCKVVKCCTEVLPEGKPRYVMGVGYPEDIIVAVALGADMFDCVWPTRVARFGTALHPQGPLNLRNRQYTHDPSPVVPGCTCTVCRPRSQGGLGLSRSYIHHLAGKETVGANESVVGFMGRIREAILEGRFPEFIKEFFREMYGGGSGRGNEESGEDGGQEVVGKKKNERGKGPPEWAVEALRGVGVDLLDGDGKGGEDKGEVEVEVEVERERKRLEPQ
ncbi:MAG: hypothetical protein Q9227_007885 [Pyrenula ochraceoflavens]